MENSQRKDWNEDFFEYFEEMDFRSADYVIPEYLEHIDLDYIDILTGESLNIPRPEHHQSAIEHRHSAISTA